MDSFLDRSDELHIEILALLEGAEAFPGMRHEVALVACGIALEHALSLPRCQDSCRLSDFS